MSDKLELMTTTDKNMRRTATAAEVILRTKSVVTWIAQKKKRAQIIVLAHAEGWAVKPSTVDIYIRKAKDEIKEMASKDQALAYVEAILDLDYLYALAVEKKDVATCLSIRREKNKLYNLYPEHSMGSNQPHEGKGRLGSPERSGEVSEAVKKIVASQGVSTPKPVEKSVYEELEAEGALAPKVSEGTEGV